MADVAISDFLKPLMIKDLRSQCRARGINPAGSKEALQDRLKDHMLETNDFNLVPEGGFWQPAAKENFATHNVAAPEPQYAYEASGAQCEPAAQNCQPKTAPPSEGYTGIGGIGHGGNNYHRPSGQNVGNFLTDRNSSRVLAPPGGASQVFFG